MQLKVISLTLAVTIFIPASIFAKIDVSILDAVINGKGEIIHISTDEELEAFGITSKAWKSFFKNSFIEKQWGPPNRTYYHDPTPYGNRFEKLQKSPTRTRVKFSKATIVNQSTELEIVAVDECCNRRFNKSMTCRLVLKTTRSNSVTSSWDKKLSLGAGVNSNTDMTLNFGLKAPFNTASVDSGLTYHPQFNFRGNFEFGSSGSSKETVELGTEMSVTTSVGPRQMVSASLIAEKLIMRVEVEYEANIEGATLVEFGRRDVDTFFPTTNVVRSNWIRTNQSLDISIYSKAKIVLSDVPEKSDAAFKNC